MRTHALLIPLLALEAFAAGYGMRSWLLPCAIVLPAYASLLTGLRLPVRPEHRYRYLLALAVLFVGLWRYDASGADHAPFSTPIEYKLLHAFAGWGLAVQVFLLCARPSFLDEGRRTRWIALGIAVVAAATSYEANLAELRVISAVHAAYTVAAALYLWGRIEWPRRIPLRPALAGAALLLAGIVAAGLGSAHLVREYALQIDLALGRMTTGAGERAAPPGLSGQGGLHAITDTQNQNRMDILLHAEAAEAPGYLRGNVFDKFEGLRWLPSSARESETLLPSESDTLPEPEEGGAWFRIAASDSPAESMSIWLEQFSNTLLVPEGTAWVSTPTRKVTRDSAGVVGTPGFKVGGYRVALGTGTQSANDPVLPEHTAVPPELDPRVRKLAEDLFAGAETNTDQARAVVEYFQQHYSYALGYVPPAGVHGLSHFLVEQPDAHCEYFATGAAVLLRLGGVPARYVTGVVTHEKNPVTGLWVARGRNAHAWTEAWDPQRGWFAIEPTPGGAAQNAPVPYRQYLAEAGAHEWRRMWDAWQQGAWNGAEQIAAAAAGFLLSTWPGRAVLLLAAVLGLWRVVYVVRHRQRRAPADYSAPLSRLLLRADRRARRLGLRRDRHETPCGFAERLEAEPQEGHALANWYRAYAAARYHPTPPDQSAIDQLNQQLP
ncbi:MAG: DUF4129 domain-containing protein [Candidatus Hydrogenedens sp.]|nr:DUF4129 domain-containing protein [Candidatus Hydrogenedens sp.]